MYDQLIKKALLHKIEFCPAKNAYCRFSRRPYCLQKLRDCDYWKKGEKTYGKSSLNRQE